MDFSPHRLWDIIGRKNNSLKNTLDISLAPNDRWKILIKKKQVVTKLGYFTVNLFERHQISTLGSIIELLKKIFKWDY